MKKLKIVFATAVLLSFAVNTFAQRGTKVKTFKKEMFNGTIENLLKPNVMGYQYVLIKDGKIAAEGADGKARTGTDGNLDMTTSTPQNIGSLMKFITGTTMINLFEKPAAKADSDYKKNGFQANLDTKVWTEFPKIWLN